MTAAPSPLPTIEQNFTLRGDGLIGAAHELRHIPS